MQRWLWIRPWHGDKRQTLSGCPESRFGQVVFGVDLVTSGTRSALEPMNEWHQRGDTFSKHFVVWRPLINDRMIEQSYITVSLSLLVMLVVASHYFTTALWESWPRQGFYPFSVTTFPNFSMTFQGQWNSHDLSQPTIHKTAHFPAQLGPTSWMKIKQPFPFLLQ